MNFPVIIHAIILKGELIYFDAKIKDMTHGMRSPRRRALIKTILLELITLKDVSKADGCLVTILTNKYATSGCR